MVTKSTTGTKQTTAHSSTVIIRLRSFSSVLNDRSWVNTEYQVSYHKQKKMSFFCRVFQLQHFVFENEIFCFPRGHSQY